MFDVKFWGAYAATRAVLPKMRDAGAVVFVSAVLSRRPGTNCAALGAACAALEALARGLALELGPRIRVNCIAPGMVRTEQHDRLPEEVAQAILLAATNGYPTGAVIDVDGGHLVRQYARS